MSLLNSSISSMPEQFVQPARWISFQKVAIFRTFSETDAHHNLSTVLKIGNDSGTGRFQILWQFSTRRVHPLRPKCCKIKTCYVVATTSTKIEAREDKNTYGLILHSNKPTWKSRADFMPGWLPSVGLDKKIVKGAYIWKIVLGKNRNHLQRSIINMF